MHIAPGQQLFYYGSRVWPDNVRKAMYDEFGGMLTWPKPHCLPFRELLAHRKIVP